MIRKQPIIKGRRDRFPAALRLSKKPSAFLDSLK